MKTTLEYFSLPARETVDVHRHHPIPASFCAFVKGAHSLFNPVFFCCRPVHKLWMVHTDSPYFVASVLNGALVRFRSFPSSAMSFGFSTRSGGRPNRRCVLPASANRRPSRRLPQELQPELDLSGIICGFVKRTDTVLQVTILVEYSIVIQRALEISTVHHIEELRAKLGG